MEPRPKRFYPAVSSLKNDYAGSVGKPIQLVSIRAFSKDGTKLTSGVIVMYRAFVGQMAAVGKVMLIHSGC